MSNKTLQEISDLIEDLMGIWRNLESRKHPDAERLFKIIHRLDVKIHEIGKQLKNLVAVIKEDRGNQDE